jgi:hypothetical protein
MFYMVAECNQRCLHNIGAWKKNWVHKNSIKEKKLLEEIHVSFFLHLEI